MFNIQELVAIQSVLQHYLVTESNGLKVNYLVQKIQRIVEGEEQFTSMVKRQEQEGLYNSKFVEQNWQKEGIEFAMSVSEIWLSGKKAIELIQGNPGRAPYLLWKARIDEDKVLYFSPGGQGKVGEFPNNLKTVFTTKNGRRVYLDMHGIMQDGNPIGFVDFCFWVGEYENNDDCMTNSIGSMKDRRFDYTPRGIQQMLSHHLGCWFDEIKISQKYEVTQNRKYQTSEEYEKNVTTQLP